VRGLQSQLLHDAPLPRRRLVLLVLVLVLAASALVGWLPGCLLQGLLLALQCLQPPLTPAASSMAVQSQRHHAGRQAAAARCC
jgi:hypothetical protein